METYVYRKRLTFLVLLIFCLCAQTAFFHFTRTPRSNSILAKMATPQSSLFKLINPSVQKKLYNGKYIYENETFCTSVRNLTILVMVLSSAGNFIRRQVLRETWTNGTFYKSYGTVKTLFLLGIQDNSSVQSMIEQEFKLHGDLVQGHFTDTYYNLSHKSAMGFKWATERCRNARYVLKTDDDIVVNLFKVFRNSIQRDNEYTYHVYCRQQSGIIRRDKGSKWYVKQDQFKNVTFYPPYCAGAFVLILNGVVPFIYESSLRTPFFHIEDVLLYGLVLHSIPGLKYKLIKRTDYNLINVSDSINCLKTWKTLCPRFIFQTLNVDEARALWESILQVYYNYSQNCAKDLL